MRSLKNTKHVVVASLFLLGTVGWANAVDGASKINSVESLPCATEAEFEVLARAIHLQGNPPGGLCDGSKRAFLGKILKLGQRLSLSELPAWKGGADAALKNPIEYIGSLVKSVGFDFSVALITAYNRGGSVFVGARFFRDSPLGAISTLVHEARHSAKEDPGHVWCAQGDYYFSSGACDSQFRNDAKAGAYAFQVSYELGLAKFSPHLEPQDREYLTLSALSVLGARFNEVPAPLALPVDVITLLDEKGQLYRLHPFLKRLVAVGTELKDDRTQRIEFHVPSNGVALFGEKKRVYTLRARRAVEPLLARTIGGLPVVDIASWMQSDSTLSHFLDDQNRLHYLSVEPSTGDLKLFPSPVSLAGMRPARLQNYLISGFSYFLDGAGKLHAVKAKTIQPDRFNVKGGWSSTGTGVLFDVLYGIDGDGVLFVGGESGPVASEFQSERRALKFAEGTDLRVLLETDNRLTLGNRTVRGVQRFPLEHPSAILDLALARHTWAGEAVRDSDKAEAAFVKRCKVTQAIREPWLDRGVGIDAEGKIVFEGDAGGESACLALALPNRKKIRSFRFTGQEDGFQFHYARISLELTDENGKISRILPYRYSESTEWPVANAAPPVKPKPPADASEARLAALVQALKDNNQKQEKELQDLLAKLNAGRMGTLMPPPASIPKFNPDHQQLVEEIVRDLERRKNGPALPPFSLPVPRKDPNEELRRLLEELNRGKIPVAPVVPVLPLPSKPAYVFEEFSGLALPRGKHWFDITLFRSSKEQAVAEMMVQLCMSSVERAVPGSTCYQPLKQPTVMACYVPSDGEKALGEMGCVGKAVGPRSSPIDGYDEKYRRLVKSR